MTSKFVQALGVVALASFGFASPLHADSVSVTFPSSNTFYSSATNGTGTIPSGGQSGFMWTSGDFIEQTFTGTGLTSVTSFSDDFVIQNVLGGFNETVNVLINGNLVGSFTALDCGFCSSNQPISFSAGPFAPIVGSGSYTIDFVLQDTIPGGGGSIAFLDGGEATLSGAAAVPGPVVGAGFPGLLAGFGAMLAWYRRRRATV